MKFPNDQPVLREMRVKTACDDRWLEHVFVDPHFSDDGRSKVSVFATAARRPSEPGWQTLSPAKIHFPKYVPVYFHG